MLDKEKLYTAKLYMDKLANGMNPFDGQDMPEDEFLNDVRLCRAFTLASDVLEQVIENGCRVSSHNKVRKIPFRITEEQISTIVITEEPVGISVIATRIRKVLDDNVKSLSSLTISNWLEAEGLLTRVTKNGKMMKIATEDGNMLGIYTKEMVYGDKHYHKTLYEMNAQVYIISNLDMIAKFGG